MSDSKPSHQEVIESIPWEELRDLGDTSRRRRVWYLVGGAALAAVLVFSVVRAFSAPDPRVAVPRTATPSTTAAPEVAASSRPATDSAALPPLTDPFAATLTEADLRTGEDPTAVGGGIYSERRAASYSEWFVLEFFARDGTGRSASLKRWPPGVTLAEEPDASATALSYVEWVRTLWAEPLGDGRWRAVVAFRRLVSTDGGVYNRLPTQSVEVVMDLGAGIPAMVDLPRFIPPPRATAGQWWVGEDWETPPTAVVKTAQEELLLSEAGAIAGQPAFSRMGEVWRVEWAVIDAAGISWPVSLWMGPEGAPLPAGG